MIDFSIVIRYLPLLISGTIKSCQIALAGCTIGFLLGVPLGIASRAKNRFISGATWLFGTIIRGTPMLIQIYYFHFVLPQFGIVLPLFWQATCAIGINSGAYIANVIRSGIGSISRGQLDAARILGLGRWQTYRYIILPQAIATVLPALGNELVTLTKDSSLASAIGVSELMRRAGQINDSTYDAITAYSSVALIYLIMTTALSALITYLERRLNRHVVP